MFNLFNKNSEKNIEKSLDKYNTILEKDVNLKIRTRYKGSAYISGIEYLNNREIVFRCPIDKRYIIRFDLEKAMNVDLLGDSGLYETKILVCEKTMIDNVLYYRGKIIAPIEKAQRRKEYRLPIILDLKYTLLPREHFEYTGNTLDISTNGILLETYENIYQTKNIRIKINIEGKNYDIKSTIIRKRANYNNGTYLYNIKFDDLSSRNKSAIARFIFDTKKYVEKSN